VLHALIVVQKMTQIEKYDRAWQHFSMIAAQRISSFNHYLIAIGVLLTAFTALSKGAHGKTILVVVSACNIIAPLCFWLIDARVCRLLRNLKSVLVSIEGEDWPDDFKPFHRDAVEQKKWKNRLSSYTPVFVGMFSLHLLAGLVLLIYSLGFPHASGSSTQSILPSELQIELQNKGTKQTVTVSDPTDLKLHLHQPKK
jgi:hypothetical protein